MLNKNGILVVLFNSAHCHYLRLHFFQVAAVKHFCNLDTQRNGNPLQPVVEHEHGPFRLCLISSCFSDVLLNHGNGRAHLQDAKSVLPSRLDLNRHQHTYSCSL